MPAKSYIINVCTARNKSWSPLVADVEMYSRLISPRHLSTRDLFTAVSSPSNRFCAFNQSFIGVSSPLILLTCFINQFVSMCTRFRVQTVSYFTIYFHRVSHLASLRRRSTAFVIAKWLQTLSEGINPTSRLVYLAFPRGSLHVTLFTCSVPLRDKVTVRRHRY